MNKEEIPQEDIKKIKLPQKNPNIGSDGYFHGLQTFMRRKYWIDEVHNIEDIIGQYCIFVQVKGVNHNPLIHTVSIRGYDNGYNQDDLNIKRPAIFNDDYTCREYMGELYFPDNRLLYMQIDREIAFNKIFKEVGAYSIRKPLIQLP